MTTVFTRARALPIYVVNVVEPKCASWFNIPSLHMVRKSRLSVTYMDQHHVKLSWDSQLDCILQVRLLSHITLERINDTVCLLS